MKFGPVWLGAAHWEMSAPGAIRYLLRYRIEKAAGLLLSTEKKGRGDRHSLRFFRYKLFYQTLP